MLHRSFRARGSRCSETSAPTSIFLYDGVAVALIDHALNSRKIVTRDDREAARVRPDRLVLAPRERDHLYAALIPTLDRNTMGSSWLTTSAMRSLTSRKTDWVFAQSDLGAPPSGK
jgi:hypothetical protein